MQNTVSDTRLRTATPEQLGNIDAMLERQEQKSSAVVYDKFKTLWNKHKIARFVTGMALAGGAIVATASGATVVAGGFIATRAILGALGGYMATDAALELANNKFTKNKLEKLISRADSGESATDLENEFRDIHRELSENLTRENIEQEMEKAKKTHQIKKTAKKVIASIVGIGIGLLGGTHAVEAATMTSNETISLVKSRVGNILDSTISLNTPAIVPDIEPNAFSAKISMKDILDDIRSDHPKQGYVTLEQAVRRIEGFKQGINLDHSSLLKKLNTSVYDLVRDPDGAVVQTMKEMKLLSEGQSVDGIAKKLTERQITEILEKTYGTEFTVQGNIPSIDPVSDATDAIVNSKETIHTIANVTFDATQKSSKLAWATGLGATLAAGALAWLGWKGLKKQGTPENTDTPDIPDSFTRPTPHTPEPNGPQGGNAFIASETIPVGEATRERSVIECSTIPETRTISPSNITPSSARQIPSSIAGEFIPTSDTIHLPDNSAQWDDGGDWEEVPETEAIVSLVGENGIKLASDEEKRMNCFVAFRGMIDEYFGFNTLIENDSNITENGFGKIVFSKPTLGGEFRTSYIQSPTKNGEIELSWYDNKIRKSTITRIPSSPEEMAIVFEKMFIETLKKRDEIKNREMLTLHTVEVSEQDLQSMYQQLEHPYVLRNGTETGGYWFQSCYGLQNGVLRFENLVNPTMDEMDLTGNSFSLKGEQGLKYMGRNSKSSIIRSFDGIEGNYIDKIHLYEHAAGVREGQKIIFMTGATSYYNYHKHPGYLNHPSSMDLNHKNAARGRFEREINTKILTWAIVNELPSHINELNKPRNSHILKRSRYGGQRDYIVSFWKVHRNATNSNYRTSDCIPLNCRVI